MKVFVVQFAHSIKKHYYDKAISCKKNHLPLVVDDCETDMILQ